MQQKPCNRHLTIRQGWRLGKPAFEQLHPQHFPKHEITSVKLGLLGKSNAEGCDQGHIRDRLVEGAAQKRMHEAQSWQAAQWERDTGMWCVTTLADTNPACMKQYLTR